MSVKPPPAPPLPDELDRLLRRLRMPYVRRAAPEVIATARAQRWEPAEVLRVLLAEEEAGRDQATTSMRRRASGLPAGKTLDAWEEQRTSIPKATQHALRTLEWVARAETSVSPDRPGPARVTSSKRSDTTRSTTARPSPGTPSNHSPCSCGATAPTTASPKRSAS